MISVVLIGAALAGQAANAEPTTFTIATAPFTVAVVTDDGKKANAVLHAYLDVQQEEQITTVCQWMPRVRDAVTRVFNDHTPRVIEQRLDLAGIDGRLVDAINEALTADLITAVHVFDAVRPRSYKKIEVANGAVVTCVGGKAKAREASTAPRKMGDVFDDKVKRRVKRRTGK